jgi:hypothetical protein
MPTRSDCHVSLCVMIVTELGTGGVLDKDGVSDFDALASRQHDKRRSSRSD